MKSRLLLLLLPAGAGLVLWIGLAVDALYFLLPPALLLLPFLLGFALQAVALYFTRQRLKWLRFAPLALLLIPIAGTAYEVSLQGMFWQLAAFIWLAAAVLYLIGWGAAWAMEGKANAR